MIDINSAAWLAIKTHIEMTLNMARTNLETQGLPQPASDFERGRIKALKDVLALSKPNVSIPESVPFN